MRGNCETIKSNEYMHVNMTLKKLTSETTIKNSPKHSLLEIAGILNYKEVEEMEQRIAESRKRSRQRMLDLRKRLQ